MPDNGKKPYSSQEACRVAPNAVQTARPRQPERSAFWRVLSGRSVATTSPVPAIVRVAQNAPAWRASMAGRQALCPALRATTGSGGMGAPASVGRGFDCVVFAAARAGQRAHPAAREPYSCLDQAREQRLRHACRRPARGGVCGRSVLDQVAERVGPCAGRGGFRGQTARRRLDTGVRRPCWRCAVEASTPAGMTRPVSGGHDRTHGHGSGKAPR